MAAKRRKKRDNQAGKVCVAFIVLVFVAVMALQMVKLYQKKADYEAQVSQLEAEYADETEKQNALKEEEEYVNSDQGIEDIAHSRLGLVKPNEKVYKEQD